MFRRHALTFAARLGVSCQVAANSGSLLVGDVLLSVNGKPVPNQPTAHRYLSEAAGALELSVHRAQESGCWMLRYYDAKNSATRVEKVCDRTRVPLGRLCEVALVLSLIHI